MDAYTEEKKSIEAAKKLEEDRNDLASLVLVLQARNAELEAQLQAKKQNELDEDEEEETKEESKVEQRGDNNLFQGMSESVNLILNFGAEPLFGVLSESQMIRDVGRALM